MTLEALAEQIAAAAKAKGEAITETAREQAKEIASESAATNAAARDQVVARAKRESDQPVSYTHLTLPTKRIV